MRIRVFFTSLLIGAASARADTLGGNHRRFPQGREGHSVSKQLRR